MEIFDVVSETHHFLEGEETDTDSDFVDGRREIKDANNNCVRNEERRNLFSVDFYLLGQWVFRWATDRQKSEENVWCLSEIDSLIYR